MSRTRRLRTLLLPAVVALAVTLSACATAAPIELSDETVVLDVRTASEYAGGHLDGAINADVTNGELAALIAELPKDDEYVVYCRSGNRSAQAVQLMRDAGFTRVTDAGAVGSASAATGLAIVTE